MKEVEADLYEFLQNNETTIYKEDNEIIIAVFVDFRDLEDFANMVGPDYFDDGGLEVIMKDSYLCIPVSDYINYCGHKISSYRNCFEDDDWKRYGEEILKLESEE